MTKHIIEVNVVENSATSSSGAGERLLELDVLRGLAAISVVIYHYSVRISQLQIPAPTQEWGFWQGQLGVQVFFMISGFVIYMSLQNLKDGNAKGALKRFAVSRFFRLYPLYWLCLLITFICVNTFGLEGRTIGADVLVANLTMLPRFMGFPFVDGVYWSLEAEIIFYAFVSVAVIYLPKLTQPLILGWLIFAALVQVAEVLLIPVSGDTTKLVETLFILRWAPFFVLGMSLFHIRQGQLYPLRRINMSLAAVLVIAEYQVGDLLVFASAAMFLYVTCVKRILVCRPRGLVFLGSISYALYLIHQNIGYIIIRELHLAFAVSQTIAVCMATLFSLFAATLITYYVERPVVKRLKSLAGIGASREPDASLVQSQI